MPHEQFTQSLHRFADHVLPALRELGNPREAAGAAAA